MEKINKRPTNADTEDDILRMQNEFLQEKSKNPSMQPAAQLIKCQREPEKKQSQFAKKRGHATTTENPVAEVKKSSGNFIVMGDVVENISFNEGRLLERDIILGDERMAFPKVEKVVLSDNKNTKKSLFAQNMEAKKRNADKTSSVPLQNEEVLLRVEKMRVDDKDPTVNHLLNDVHEENLDRLKNMNEKEILQERQQLLHQLDPKLIEMLKARKNANKANLVASVADVKMEIPASFEMPDILGEKNSENWLNFDVVEPKKLEWMKHIDENYPKLKPGEQYEARFDWKGFLLPYTEQDADAAIRDNRELYLHGDDVHRPGYTLQELFRLARSNVLQQRVSALNAISGIICIYNQGYYDGVLEVPISKIFFLLRYSMDENALPVLEAALKGFSLLFYNEVDETLLDVICESHEYTQIPNLKPISKINTDIEKQMNDMHLQNPNFSFKTNIEEQEMANISEMNDFHLAETDLYECLLRTNILDRIRYILGTLKPDSPIVLSCFKILIAIARVNERFAEKLACTEDLIYTLIENFIPNIQESPQKDKLYYNRPQILVLKLLRIISSVHLKYAFRLKNYEYIQLLLKSYLFMREDINEELIQLQIETFRLVRAWARYFRCDDFYRSLLPALRFFLEWHYQFLEIEKSNHFLIRQHASALIALLEYCDHCQFMDIFASTFRNCFAKWCTILMEKCTTVKEISQSVLLMCCVQTSRLLLETCEREFNFLEKFLQSKCFDNYCENLSDSSILLSSNPDRRYFHQPLPNFGSIVTEKSNNSSPSVIIKQNYQFILLNSLMQLFPFELINCKLNKMNKYFEKFISKKLINKNMIINLFNKFEINFILFYLKFININYQNKLLPSISKNLQLKLSYKILNCLTGRYYAEINYILENFVFSTKFYEIFTAKSEENVLNENFLKNLKINYINLLDTHLCRNYDNDTEIALPSYWPYLPLWSLFDRSQNPPPPLINAEPGEEEMIVQEFNEELLINMSLNFLNLLKYELKSNFKSNDYLLLLMLPYFSTELKFLDLDVKFMLNEHKKNLCAELDRLEFNFNAMLLNDKLSFEKFYLAFLEQFQSSSYGDELFSALVMLPLQQKYDAKWRKIVWSEYVAVLRFINCSEEELIGGTLDNYLYPAECDVSLLKCYNIALKSNLLKINSIPFKIAEYHVNKFLSKENKKN